MELSLFTVMLSSSVFEYFLFFIFNIYQEYLNNFESHFKDVFQVFKGLDLVFAFEILLIECHLNHKLFYAMSTEHQI